MIKILGLGPGDKESLTLGTIETLKKYKNIFFRTEKHPTVEYIQELGIEFKTYDSIYETYESFDDVYKVIAEDLIKNVKELNEIVYAVPGHPMVAEKSVGLVIELCKKENIGFEIVPAVSFLEAIMQSLKIDPVEGMKIVDAFEIKNTILSQDEATIITQVYNNLIASEVKLALLEYFKDDEEIYFVRGAGIKGVESIRKIKIYEIDRQEDIDYLTSLYIPKGTRAYRGFYDLVKIMDILRAPNGCPWDIQQDHKTIKRCLIEECYETLEAIDEEDDNKLIEELGDVLLQVVFHAKIGKDEGFFNVYDVTESICKKMISRHPHVFGKINLDTAEKVLDNWDSIKKQENAFSTYTEELEHIAKNLPSLIRAEKVQKKAAKVGFDWDNIEPALEKINEEYNEVREVYNSNNKAKIIDELGDLFFAVVNVCRFLEVDPEEAVNHTTEKFIRRFKFIEDSAAQLGLSIENMTLEQMDGLWEKSKK